MNYEIYQEGIDARYAQQGFNTNPYPDNTSDHHDWYSGWADCDEALYRNGKATQAI